jgi:hypothetical protein
MKYLKLYEKFELVTKDTISNVKFYHGTIAEIWEDTQYDSYLFVVECIEVAKKHALDRIEYQKGTPIVVEISVNDIKHLRWEADDDLGNWPYKTWQESYKEVGSFVVVGKIPIHKFPIIWQSNS